MDILEVFHHHAHDSLTSMLTFPKLLAYFKKSNWYVQSCFATSHICLTYGTNSHDRPNSNRKPECTYASESCHSASWCHHADEFTQQSKAVKLSLRSFAIRQSCFSSGNIVLTYVNSSLLLSITRWLTTRKQLFHALDDGELCSMEMPFPEPDNVTKMRRSEQNAHDIGETCP